MLLERIGSVGLGGREVKGEECAVVIRVVNLVMQETSLLSALPLQNYFILFFLLLSR